jgi:hypothetical protein
MVHGGLREKFHFGHPEIVATEKDVHQKNLETYSVNNRFNPSDISI